MKRALVLARKGLGTTTPNPMVGAIVLDASGKIVGHGYHQKAGQAHAETFALQAAGSRAKSGALYVTLEPCCHHGKTPPCVDQILQSKVGKVIVAVTDPNPKVAGQSIAKLREHGVEVVVGCMERQAQKLNRVFFKHIQHKTIFVSAKAALTRDHYIGIQGQRAQISDAMMERTTMKLRAGAGAVLVGVQTVLADDPSLNVRGRYCDRQPVRIILDPGLKTPTTAKLFQAPGPIWIFHRHDADASSRARLLLHRQLECIPLKTDGDGKLDPCEILEYLKSRNVVSVLIEGGVKTFQVFHERGLIDEWTIYLNEKNMQDIHQSGSAIHFSLNPPLRLIAQSGITRTHDLELSAQPYFG